MSEDTPPERAADEAAETAATDAETAEAGKSPNWFYRIAASGVGAFVLAQEEIENRLKRLTGAQNALDDADEDAAPAEPSEPSEESEEQEPVPAGKERRPIGDYIDTTIANVLHSMSMPSHQDVEELSRKIDALSEKVERLRSAS